VIRPRRVASPADVSRHYDTLDPFYRELWGEHLHHGLWERGDEKPDEAVIALVHRVAAAAGITPGATVCDVGSGYGATTRLLARELGATVTAYTLSPVQHAHAQSRAAGDARIRHELGDWLAARIEPASFDAVIAIESTAHMEDKPAFFAKAASALKPGGRVVVCAWLSSGRERAWQRRMLLEPICDEGRLPSLGTPDEYVEWIAATGLVLESFEDLSDRVRKTWSISSRRLARRLLTRDAWAFLLDARNRDRIFALSVPRIQLAYATGCMRYGFFVARRSD
jgi:tocopherol O-methyltransferase